MKTTTATLSTLARLQDLRACEEARTFIATHTSLRAAWEECDRLEWLTWLVGCAHRRGTLPRTRLVAFALRCVEPVAHLLPDESIDDLGIVAAWTVGEATFEDVWAARRRILDVYRKADRARWTAAAAYAAATAAAAADDAYAAADADDAAYAATSSSSTTVSPETRSVAREAMCDVVRAAISIDELCAALQIDPDAPTMEVRGVAA